MSVDSSSTAPAEVPPPALELGFWRTIYRYLLSIVASLATGAAWYFAGIRFLHLDVLGTIFTGVIALAVGFFVMGYLWLSLDLSRPVPEGVDKDERDAQLFVLWLGIPLAVLAVCGFVALVSVLIAATALRDGIPRPR